MCVSAHGSIPVEGMNGRSGKNVPCIGRRLEEKCDISSGDVEGAHANDEANEAYADWTDNVPELYDSQCLKFLGSNVS